VRIPVKGTPILVVADAILRMFLINNLADSRYFVRPAKIVNCDKPVEKTLIPVKIRKLLLTTSKHLAKLPLSQGDGP
jgi:hypothetical protein